MKLGKKNAINRLYFERFAGGYAAYIQVPNSDESVKIAFCARVLYYWKGYMRGNPELTHDFPTLGAWVKFCARYVRYHGL